MTITLQLTGTTFAISNDAGQTLGLALACHDARYLSIQWAGASRLERLHPSPAEWREIEHQIRNGLDPRPLSLETPIGAFLGIKDAERRRVAWVHSVPIDVADPLTTAHALDAHLTKQAIKLLLRTKPFQEGGA